MQRVAVRIIGSEGVNRRFLVKLSDDGLLSLSDGPVDDVSSEIIELVYESIRKLGKTSGAIDEIVIKDGGGRSARLIVEVVRERISLVIFGAGHVGRAIAQLAVLVGYKVLLVDDRREFLFLDKSGTDEDEIECVYDKFEVVARNLPELGNTAVVIVTRGHQYDEICLRSVIDSKASYIGMIGSRRRVLSIFHRLEMEGVDKAKLSGIYAPIGLRIGAVTPHEIAVSVIAEVIAKLNGSGLENICHLKV